MNPVVILSYHTGHAVVLCYLLSLMVSKCAVLLASNMQAQQKNVKSMTTCDYLHGLVTKCSFLTRPKPIF